MPLSSTKAALKLSIPRNNYGKLANKWNSYWIFIVFATVRIYCCRLAMETVQYSIVLFFSPSIEVDRAPCAEANMKPACQLGPQECSAIGNQLSQKTLRNIKRNMRSRSSSVKTGRQNGGRRQKSAQWTKVRSFEELVKGKSAKRSRHTKQGGFRKMEETPLPDFNCAKYVCKLVPYFQSCHVTFQPSRWFCSAPLKLPT